MKRGKRRRKSKKSQRGYRHTIDEFITWYCSEPRLSFNKAVATRYRIHLESRQLDASPSAGRYRSSRFGTATLAANDVQVFLRDMRHRGTMGAQKPRVFILIACAELWMVPAPSGNE